jgi:FAD dependent oxidoreductase
MQLQGNAWQPQCLVSRNTPPSGPRCTAFSSAKLHGLFPRQKGARKPGRCGRGLLLTAQAETTDILILGAGIIGLACARKVLIQHPDARVTLLEQGPGVCSGATGAGVAQFQLDTQDVGLRSHCNFQATVQRDDCIVSKADAIATRVVQARATSGWDIATSMTVPCGSLLCAGESSGQKCKSRSQVLGALQRRDNWTSAHEKRNAMVVTPAYVLSACAPLQRTFTIGIYVNAFVVKHREQCRHAEALGYRAAPSLLCAADAAGAGQLHQRREALSDAGLNATLLSARDAAAIEPLLHLPEAGAAIRVASDMQIDAHRASEYLLRCCQELGGSEGRFEMRCGVTVERLLMECCSVEIGGVATSAGEYNCLYAATAFVLAFLCNMLCVRCTALVVR